MQGFYLTDTIFTAYVSLFRTGIIFSVTAAIIICEFLVQDNLVTLTQLQNGATMALQNLIGKKYKLEQLIQVRLSVVDEEKTSWISYTDLVSVVADGRCGYFSRV